MPLSERQEKLRGHLGRGIFLSFTIHASIVFPFMVLAVLFARREAEQRDLDVNFEEVSAEELPNDLPPLDDEPSQIPPPRPEPPQPKPIAQRAPTEALEKPPQAEPLKAEALPLPPKPEKAHEKMVDLDMGQEAEPPPDAKYLAQKNNRAKEETRAKDTNLEREMKGSSASSSPSERTDEQIGDDKQKVARDEDQKSKRGRAAPAVTPHTDPKLAQSQSKAPSKSLLAMRDAPKRQHDVTPETADPSLPHDPEGAQPLIDKRPPSVKDLGGTPGSNDQSKLALSGKQYEYLFGDDAEAARELASKQRSKRKGRFSERMGQIQSALENFIPEVKPGNQTALNTRAAPFAAFIARMHRNIHELWGFGFLEDLERKPASNPLNNMGLITKLEIVLNGDGTISKINIVKASGLTQFDVAAIDAVYSAGPYPDPPNEIRSANGKIYVHWTFHRDERQCATSGVDYYILDNAPAGGDKGETETSSPMAGPTPSPQLKRLDRTPAPDTAAHRAKRRALDEAVGREEPDHDANRRVAQEVVRADDPAALASAQRWFSAFLQGDLDRLTREAVFPFRSTTGVAAQKPDELRHLLESLLDESPAPRTLRSLQLYSPAGVRGALGSLPPGFDDGATNSIFAVGQVSGDTLILVLSRHKGAWHPTGLVRR